MNPLPRVGSGWVEVITGSMFSGKSEELIRRMRRAEIARQRVVAPELVSAWIPIDHDHAYPMVVRSYPNPLRERVGEIAYRDRVLMTRFADGDLEHPRAAAIFERGLELYDVQAVGIANSEHLGSAREILRRAGFVKRIQATDLEIWARGAPE